jgi:nitrogen regulatory protein PII
MLLVFKQSIHKNEKITEEMLKKASRFRPKEDKGENMANEIYHDAITHDLIVSIVNQGYSDELMNTAREAGASGGTVINARGQTHDGAVRFFGISVHDEKELILILTSRERKVSIMQAICEAHGLNSKAGGIVFSLPVDCVMGLYLE